MFRDRTTTKPATLKALLLGLLALTAGAASAQQTVYRCAEDDGSVTFSDQRCSEQPDVLLIEESHNPPPPRRYSPRPLMADEARQGRQNTRQQAAHPQPDMSYRCSASNGEAWYQHSPCSSSINVREPEHFTGTAINTGNPVRGTALVNRSVPVEQTEVPRSTACSAIYATGSNRRGSRKDQKYNTYDRNRGLDPCR